MVVNLDQEAGILETLVIDTVLIGRIQDNGRGLCNRIIIDTVTGREWCLVACLIAQGIDFLVREVFFEPGHQGTL